MFLTHCLDFRSDSKIVFCTIISGHHPLKNGAWEISLSFWEGLFSGSFDVSFKIVSRVSSNHSFGPPGHPVDENPSNPFESCAGWRLFQPHACSMASRKGIKTSLGSIKIPDPQPVLQQPRPCYPEWGRLKKKLLRQGFWTKKAINQGSLYGYRLMVYILLFHVFLLKHFQNTCYLPWNTGLWRTGSFFHAVWHESNEKNYSEFIAKCYNRRSQGFSLVSSFSFSCFLFNSSTSWITKNFSYLIWRYERTLFQANFFWGWGETPLHNPHPYSLCRWGFLHGNHCHRGTWY